MKANECDIEHEAELKILPLEKRHLPTHPSYLSSYLPTCLQILSYSDRNNESVSSASGFAPEMDPYRDAGMATTDPRL